MSMADTEVEMGEFRFSIDSSLLFQLGEQLVAKPSIALAELVKNAYDADATKVTVTMEHVAKPGGTMLIEDDGHGMTFEELRDGWMRIATTHKRANPVSRLYRRPLSGAKGIGRFAARRLGGKLTLQSTACRLDGGKEVIVASFDWMSSFLPGQTLGDIPVSYTRRAIAANTGTGVSLLIEGLRDAWTPDDIAGLKRDLLSLQSPFPDLVVTLAPRGDAAIVPDPGFDFQLRVEGSTELDGLAGGLGEAFLKTAWGKLDGEVDANGCARYALTGLKTGEVDELLDVENNYLGLAGARFRVYFFVYAAQYYEGTSFGVRDAQRKGREDGGVRIYLDGFRVFPYGDPGDDWLQLDYYAARNIDMAPAITPSSAVLDLSSSLEGRPFLLIPKNQQVFGVVAISQTGQSQIGVNISRERLLETPTVLGLRRFVQNGIYWMTVKYAAHLADEQARGKRGRAKTAQEIIDEARTAIMAQAALPEEQRFLIVRSLDEATQRIRVEEQERISEIAMLRTLASAGTTISLMNHQLQALTGAVLQARADLQQLRAEIPEAALARYDSITEQVTDWHELVEQQVSQLGFLLAPDTRQRRRRHALHEIVENVRKPMSYYMRLYGVEFENNVPRDLRTPPIYQAELYSILINILSNALKFIHGQPVRRVAVEAGRIGGKLLIRMLDTGVGVPCERREEVFKPFVTTSVPNPILGVGTGLGLKVVRDVLESYGGTARFIDAPKPWKTCIELELPGRDTADGL
jgi:signal transduction histidine kinase